MGSNSWCLLVMGSYIGSVMTQKHARSLYWQVNVAMKSHKIACILLLRMFPYGFDISWENDLLNIRIHETVEWEHIKNKKYVLVTTLTEWIFGTQMIFNIGVTLENIYAILFTEKCYQTDFVIFVISHTLCAIKSSVLLHSRSVACLVIRIIKCNLKLIQ